MLIKLLTAEQRAEVYSQFMKRHFHKNELKPRNEIEKLISEDKYACYGLYTSKGDGLVGYAYFVKDEDNEILLLDYFAVLKLYRSHGIGSRFLKQMKKSFTGEYKAVLAEVENPDYAVNEEERRLQKRRIRFYLRNGLNLSNVLSEVYGSEYVIMVLNLDKPLKDEAVLEKMKLIYKATLKNDQAIHLRRVDELNSKQHFKE